MRRKPKKKIILAAVAASVLAVLWLLSMRHLDFATVQRFTRQIQSAATAHIAITFVSLMAIQALGMFFTLPTKAIFNLVGGALLGVIPGAIMTLLGTLLGTSGLFFATQKIVHPNTLDKLPSALKKFEQRLQTRPSVTVASLRMILALPYGAITIFCAVMRIPFRSFFIGSLLGDTPVVLLYAAAGLKLAELAGTNEALSVQTVVLLSLAGIGLLAGTLWPSKKSKGKSLQPSESED
ncbi:MAG: VTT domain-containing protein [Deltaproteobacteria bacterium]|nr:VTT domain-containing protein [Deltaproteobacteria bacterium]